LVRRHQNGLILDVGAGKRTTYLDNVVNYETVAYDSTDVLGVADILPFKDKSFDAIITVAALEHVKDPFRCSREMSGVLKKEENCSLRCRFSALFMHIRITTTI
jgi:hypothetical protein